MPTIIRANPSTQVDTGLQNAGYDTTTDPAQILSLLLNKKKGDNNAAAVSPTGEATTVTEPAKGDASPTPGTTRMKATRVANPSVLSSLQTFGNVAESMAPEVKGYSPKEIDLSALTDSGPVATGAPQAAASTSLPTGAPETGASTSFLNEPKPYPDATTAKKQPGLFGDPAIDEGKVGSIVNDPKFIRAAVFGLGFLNAPAGGGNTGDIIKGFVHGMGALGGTIQAQHEREKQEQEMSLSQTRQNVAQMQAQAQVATERQKAAAAMDTEREATNAKLRQAAIAQGFDAQKVDAELSAKKYTDMTTFMHALAMADARAFASEVERSTTLDPRKLSVDLFNTISHGYSAQKPFDYMNTMPGFDEYARQNFKVIAQSSPLLKPLVAKAFLEPEEIAGPDGKKSVSPPVAEWKLFQDKGGSYLIQKGKDGQKVPASPADLQALQSYARFKKMGAFDPDEIKGPYTTDEEGKKKPVHFP